jgi:hypothetical protein
MKIQVTALRILAVATAGFCLASVHAAEKKVAGPNGGRILTKVEPRAEFFVMPDRKVQITFLDKAGKPIAPVEQTVIVTAGERSAPKTLTFAKSGAALVSNVALPAGDIVPTVVQIKPTPSGGLVTERFNVDMSKCGECKHAEYACICDH